MAPPLRSKPLKKDVFPSVYKTVKPVLFTESATTSTRPPQLTPNIRGLSWSAAGSLVATCTSAQIRVWDPERPNVKSSTEIRNGHNGSFAGAPGGSGVQVEKLAFCPTMENMLSSVGNDGGVRLWDVRVPGGAAGGAKGSGLADCRVYEPGREAAMFLTWHPNGTEMLVGKRDDAVHTVDVRRMMDMDDTSRKWSLDATVRTPLEGPKTSPRYNQMSFSNSGREVFAATSEGPVQIIDYSTMSVLYTVRGHAQSTYTAQHSPRGDWLAVGAADGMVTFWDTYDWHCSHALTGHTSTVRGLSFSFDGNYVALGSGVGDKDGSPGMEIYHADTGDVAYTVETNNPVTVAAWHPYRYWIAYAGDPGGLKIAGAGSSV